MYYYHNPSVGNTRSISYSEQVGCEELSPDICMNPAFPDKQISCKFFVYMKENKHLNTKQNSY